MRETAADNLIILKIRNLKRIPAVFTPLDQNIGDKVVLFSFWVSFVETNNIIIITACCWMVLYILETTHLDGLKVISILCYELT